MRVESDRPRDRVGRRVTRERKMKPDEPDEDPLLTPAEVAARLRVSLATAKRVISKNRPVVIGRLLRWPRSELDAFLRRGGMPVVRGSKS